MIFGNRKIVKWTSTFAVVTSLVAPGLTAFARPGDAKPSGEHKKIGKDYVAKDLDEGESEDILDPRVYDLMGEILSLPEGELESENKRLLARALRGEEFQKLFNEEWAASLKKAEAAEAKDQAKAKDEISRFGKELNRSEVEIPVEFTLPIGGGFIAARFNRTVSPFAPTSGQLRVDSIELEAGVSKTLRATAKVRVTLAKVLNQSSVDRSENFKWAVVKSKVDLFKKIPTSAQDVKNLNVGEIIRVEIDGDLGLQANKSNDTKARREHIGVGYKKSATFITEFNRFSPLETRVKFLGLKNRGRFELSISGRRFLTGTAIPGAVGKALSVGFDFGLEAGDRILHQYPVDTMMVQYAFNLNKPEALSALDEIITNVKTGSFRPLFNVSVKKEDLVSDLLKAAKSAEALAQEDKTKDIKDGEYRVKHLFRGRMLSQYYRVPIGANLSILFDGRRVQGGSNTIIRKVEDDNSVTPYILLNQYTDGQLRVGLSNILKVVKEGSRFDLDYLTKAVVIKKGDNEDYLAGDFIDLVTRYQDNSFKYSASEMNKLGQQIRMSLPKGLSEASNLDKIIPTGNQHSANYIVETSINKEGFNALKTIPRENLWNSMIHWLDKHPEKYKMNLGDVAVGEQSAKPLWETTSEIVWPLHRILNNEAVNKDNIKDFKRLMDKEFFGRWIVGQFLPSQLPDQGIEKMMSYKFQFSSADIANPINQTLGKKTEDGVYRAVSELRRVLTDRAFELSNSEVSGNND